MAGRDLLLNIFTKADKRGLDQAAAGFDKLADKVDRTGESMGDTAKEGSHLERQIESTRKKLQDLGRAFAESGDKDTLKAWRAASRELSGLEKVAKSLGDSGVGGMGEVVEKVATGLETAGKKGMKAFGAAVSEAFDALPKEIKIGVAVTAAGGAVAAGGGLATAGILSALGLGTIGAGVAIALKSPEVDDAVKGLGERVSSRIKEAGAKSFNQPVIAATKAFEDAFDGVIPRIERSFSNLAPMVEPLARGLAGFATKAMPGIEKAIAASKPFIAELAIWLPRLGKGVDSFMDSLADGSKGGLRMFNILLSDINVTLKVVGNAIEFTARGFDLMMQAASRAADIAARLTGWIPLLGDATKSVSEGWQKWNSNIEYSASAAGMTSDAMTDALGRISGSTDGATAAVGRLNAEFDTLFGKTMSVDQAAIGYEESIDALSESLKENGRSFDISSEKGRNNRQAILEVVQGAQELRQANIDAGMSTDEANKKYQQQIAALEGVLRKAGMTKDQIAALIEKYKQVPEGKKVLGIELRYTVTGKQVLPNFVGSKIAAFAEGGVTPKNEPFLVGENGPEIMQLGQHSTVTPIEQGTGARTPLAALGGGTSRLVISPDGTRMADLLLEILRESIRVRGGDVQVVLGG